MKNKNIAGILALMFGGFGVHRFYLGQRALGFCYLGLLFFSFLIKAPIVWIIAFIDAIIFFSMDRDEFDVKFNRPHLKKLRKKRYDTDFDRPYAPDEEVRHQRHGRRRHHARSRSARSKYDNPHKQLGIQKYREFDYEGAIEEFLKALEINPNDIPTHFNLACAYSLTEQKEQAFHHLDRAVALGFKDFEKIDTHDALAYLRIQPEFEEFKAAGYRRMPQPTPPSEEENLLEASPDLLDQLKKLSELRERGFLTQEEFDLQKRKLLE